MKKFIATLVRSLCSGVIPQTVPEPVQRITRGSVATCQRQPAFALAGPREAPLFVAEAFSKSTLRHDGAELKGQSCVVDVRRCRRTADQIDGCDSSANAPAPFLRALLSAFSAPWGA